MAQIYYDALGKHGAMGFIAFLFIVQYMMGLSIVVAASRQMWAFSRDGALPFSPFFRPIVRTLMLVLFRIFYFGLTSGPHIVQEIRIHPRPRRLGSCLCRHCSRTSLSDRFRRSLCPLFFGRGR